jgi:hypothetical protein
MNAKIKLKTQLNSNTTIVDSLEEFYSDEN